MKRKTSKLLLLLALGLVALAAMAGIVHSATIKSCSGIFAGMRCVDKVFSLDESLPVIQVPRFQRSMNLEGFGTAMTRITRDGMFDSAQGDERPAHRYSRRQAFNTDEALIDLGTGIVRSDDLSVLVDGIPMTTERNWSYTNPDWMYGISADPDANIFGRLDVHSGEYMPIHKLDAYKTCTLGAGEGNLSWDDQYVVFACKKDNSDQTYLISYDITNRVELGTITAEPEFNWASYTASGRFIVVENNVAGNDPEDLENIVRYAPDFTGKTVLTTDRNHGDLGIDTSGRDVLVMLDWYRVSYIEIETGRRILLGVADRDNYPGHGHVSCQNYKRPGWCYISGGDSNILGAVKIEEDTSFLAAARYIFNSNVSAGVSEFEPWGFHYSSYDSYKTSAKASVSPSGSQLIFTSDWGVVGQTYEYVLKPQEFLSLF